MHEAWSAALPPASDIAALLVVAVALALIGGAMVHIAGRVERTRLEHHTDQYGEPATHTQQQRPWVRFLERWLLP
jgi:hypothetical protein